MRVKMKRVWAVAVLWSLTSGCNDEVAPGVVVEDCQALCAKFELCDSSAVETDCTESCIVDQARSPDLIEVSSRCVEAASCDEVSSGAYDNCVIDRVGNFPVRTIDETFCEEYAQKTADCAGTDDPDTLEQECVDLVRAFLSDYVTSVGACLDKACSGVQLCMGEVAVDFRTNVIMPFFSDPTTTPDDQCCNEADSCGWGGDGFCDCSGAYEWDAGDCGI